MKKVDVDYAAKKAFVTCGGPCEKAELVSALEKAGYGVTSVK